MRGMGPKEIYDLLDGVETWEKATRRQRLLFVGDRRNGNVALTIQRKELQCRLDKINPLATAN